VLHAAGPARHHPPEPRHVPHLSGRFVVAIRAGSPDHPAAAGAASDSLADAADGQVCRCVPGAGDQRLPLPLSAPPAPPKPPLLHVRPSRSVRTVPGPVAAASTGCVPPPLWMDENHRSRGLPWTVGVLRDRAVGALRIQPYSTRRATNRRQR
jgi:hypothetical protein